MNATLYKSTYLLSLLFCSTLVYAGQGNAMVAARVVGGTQERLRWKAVRKVYQLSRN